MRAAAVAITGVALASCQGPVGTCPTYRTVSAVYLDFRDVGLRGNIGGRLCLDAMCQSLQDWLTVGNVAPGRIRLDTAPGATQVTLRVRLQGDRSADVFEAMTLVPLLPRTSGRSGCPPSGHSRSVTATGGALTLGASRPDWA